MIVILTLPYPTLPYPTLPYPTYLPYIIIPLPLPIPTLPTLPTLPTYLITHLHTYPKTPKPQNPSRISKNLKVAILRFILNIDCKWQKNWNTLKYRYISLSVLFDNFSCNFCSKFHLYLCLLELACFGFSKTFFIALFLSRSCSFSDFFFVFKSFAVSSSFLMSLP